MEQRCSFESGWIGVWKYISFKSIYNMMASFQTEAKTSVMVSTLNLLRCMKAISWDKWLIGLHLLEAFSDRKNLQKNEELPFKTLSTVPVNSIMLFWPEVPRSSRTPNCTKGTIKISMSLEDDCEKLCSSRSKAL